MKPWKLHDSNRVPVTPFSGRYVIYSGPNQVASVCNAKIARMLMYSREMLAMLEKKNEENPDAEIKALIKKANPPKK